MKNLENLGLLVCCEPINFYTPQVKRELHLPQNSGTAYKNCSSWIKSHWKWKMCSLCWKYHLKQQRLWSSSEHETPSGWSWQGAAGAGATSAHLSAERRIKKEQPRAANGAAAQLLSPEFVLCVVLAGTVSKNKQQIWFWLFSSPVHKQTRPSCIL